MNSLFSSPWKQDEESEEVQMMGSAAAAAGASLDRFFEDVEAIEDELKEIDHLQRSLEEMNEAGKTLHNASAVKSLCSKMDADVALALKKAKIIKLKLASLHCSNAANRSLPGCGPGTSTDRKRTSVVSGLGRKLKDPMHAFDELRKKILAEYREIVERRYYTVTGERPDEATVDALVETGEGERFMQRAIEQQGQGNVIDVISEIQERHNAVTQIERSLLELQQVFFGVYIEVILTTERAHGCYMGSEVGKSQSFVDVWKQLQVARNRQKNTRKWTCFAIILLLVIYLVIVLPIVLNNKK